MCSFRAVETSWLVSVRKSVVNLPCRSIIFHRMYPISVPMRLVFIENYVCFLNRILLASPPTMCI
jgi:hypothetical protein